MRIFITQYFLLLFYRTRISCHFRLLCNLPPPFSLPFRSASVMSQKVIAFAQMQTKQPPFKRKRNRKQKNPELVKMGGDVFKKRRQDSHHILNNWPTRDAVSFRFAKFLFHVSRLSLSHPTTKSLAKRCNRSMDWRRVNKLNIVRKFFIIMLQSPAA